MAHKATLAKHKTILNHLTEYRANLNFDDIDDKSLYRLELFLVNKGFSEVIALKWSNLYGDILDTTAQKTGQRKRRPIAEDALRILAKYPPAPDEQVPSQFPTISNQKFNAHMKEVGKLAGLTDDWIIDAKRKNPNKKDGEEVCSFDFSLWPSHIHNIVYAQRHVSRGYTSRKGAYYCRNDDEVCQV